MAKAYEVAVVGAGGLYGMSVLQELSKRLGRDVIGFEQFDIPNNFGSSHGDSRIFRLAIGEGEIFTPLALRSLRLLRELEVVTGSSLYFQTGGLIMASPNDRTLHGSSNFLGKTIASADEFGIPYRLMDAKAIAKNYPQFNLNGDETGYYEFDAGYIDPEECIVAKKKMAVQHGAQMVTNEEVIKVISPTAQRSDFLIITSKRPYYAKKIVLTAGPWANKFFPESLLSKIEVHREVLFWFQVSQPEEYRVGKFPVFVWQKGQAGDFLYGFPSINGQDGRIKIATERTELVANPDAINREVSETEIGEMYKYSRQFLPDLQSNCIKTEVCMYTNTSDRRFIIDWHPEIRNMLLVSACSGHGAKHSFGAGESIAQMVLGHRTNCDLSHFNLKRFL